MRRKDSAAARHAAPGTLLKRSTHPTGAQPTGTHVTGTHVTQTHPTGTCFAEVILVYMAKKITPFSSLNFLLTLYLILSGFVGLLSVFFVRSCAITQFMCRSAKFHFPGIAGGEPTLFSKHAIY